MRRSLRRYREESRGKKRSDKTTAALSSESASAARDLREAPVEPDTNPKRRLLMKPASSTASGSGLLRGQSQRQSQ